MVRHHVAQRTCRIVEFAAAADIDDLGGGDLHMVDVAAVPQGLDHHVGETRRHQVLHRLLAEEMVEPVDLAFPDLGENLRIERLRRGEIGAERFFDRDTAEDAIAFIGQPMRRELLDDRPEEGWRHREIEGGIGIRPQPLADLDENIVLGEIA